MNTTAQSWLDVQCSSIPGVSRAVVLTRAADGIGLELAARWPTNLEGNPQQLSTAAEQAASSRAGVVQGQGNTSSETSSSVIASPLVTASTDYGAVALEVEDGAKSQHQAVLQLLQWGTSWFDLLAREPAANSQSNARFAELVELLANGLEHERFLATATGLVTELAGRFNCERVSLGLLSGNTIDVVAMSHSATVDRRSNITRDIAAAMHECIDQDQTVDFPPSNDRTMSISAAQELLSERAGGSAICSTPLYSGKRAIGALTFERAAGLTFGRPSKDAFEAIGAVLGPIIELKHEHDRWIGLKVWDSFTHGLRRLLGRGEIALKLTVVMLLAVVAFLSVAEGSYRITGSATLDGSVKRAVTALQPGFIASAAVRAGDKVEAGAVLARLDDKDLRLEKVALESQYEQLRKEHRGALSQHDRAKAAIVKVQMKQTEAELALLEERLGRMALRAPFGGIVVSGDLSQSLGAPVENGQVLFEIAPLDSYRVILNIDERDVGNVSEGQVGRLALAGMPSAPLDVTVHRVLPVSVAENGSNFFQIEAKLETVRPELRPGMQGVAKLDAGSRKLIWIWCHTLVDWLRLLSWTWMP